MRWIGGMALPLVVALIVILGMIIVINVLVGMFGA
jgi:hypothetical protein